MELLGQGSKGPLVQLLQTALKRSGQYQGNIDGVFGAETKGAVQLFQSRQNLSPDGVAGGNTWQGLRPYLNRTVQYAVKPGDSLFRIAKMHNLRPAELLAANRDIGEESTIYPGQKLTVPWTGSVINSGIPYSSGVMASDIAALQARYGFLGIESLGQSVLGTDIPCLRFGGGALQVLYNASHHANEWITTPLAMTFLEQLCGSLVRREELYGQSVAALYEKVSLFVVPMVNPDGVDLVTGQIQPGTEAYENAYALRGTLSFPSAWKANIRGVDLNNNYPALFEEGKTEKESQGRNYPGPRDYTGPYPLSEPESAAMAAFTRRMSARLTISLHTQGREIYWQFDNITPPNGLRIGERMAAVSGYALTDPAGPSYGGYKDWFILTYNLPGYTVEAGEGVNPLPLSDLTTIYGEVMPILVTGMTEVL